MKMKPNYFLSAIVAGLTCLGGLEAEAVTVLVDFGTASAATTTDSSMRTWNTTNSSGNVTNLNDTAGNATGFGLAFTGTVTDRLNNDFTHTGEVLSRSWPTSATHDTLNVAGTLSFTISNLDLNTDYTIDLYSARFGGAFTTRPGDYTIAGSGTAIQQNNFQANENSGNLVSATLKPDDSGNIVVTISPDNDHTYINVLQITSVPEPGAALLSSAGLAGLLLRRRRQ